MKGYDEWIEKYPQGSCYVACEKAYTAGYRQAIEDAIEICRTAHYEIDPVSGMTKRTTVMVIKDKIRKLLEVVKSEGTER